MKILYFMLISLFFCCILFFQLWKMRGEEIARLKYENSLLISEKEEFKNAQISSNKLIRKLREASATPKGDVVDCYNIHLPDYVMQLLSDLK